MRLCLVLSLSCGLWAVESSAQEMPKYTGPGSCAAPSCHGGVQARSDTSVLQNEYSTWVVKDKHPHAYEALKSKVAVRMAKALGLPDAVSASRCLACHAVSAPKEQRSPNFTDIGDGVSCELCHGPASNWLGSHMSGDWKKLSAQQKAATGYVDLHEPTQRAEQCLTCHLGTQDRNVDHELIAAGHPDLYFELASFQQAMPAHWKEKNLDKDPWFEVRTFAAAQGMQLSKQLDRVARNATTGIWPEYADLDCFACHHSLTNAENSWQQERGYAGHRPGNPPWQLSRFVVLKQVLNEVDASSAKSLETSVNQMSASVTALNNNKTAIAAQAKSLADTVAKIAKMLESANYDQARASRILKGIAGDADYISRQGERAAEQATMAINATYNAVSAQSRPANDAQIRAGIKGLFAQLDNPSAYNAFKFADALKALAGLLP
jgi:Cytochrome c554 and c-prime